DNVKKVDLLCRKSTQRLLALLAIGGLGAPRWDYATFTTFVGMNSKTQPEDLVRAVTEGIGFLISDIVSTVRDAGLVVGFLRASGGLSQTGYLLQFESDLLQIPIARVQESEATALGAAALAARQAGLPWSSVLKSPRVEREFKP